MRETDVLIVGGSLGAAAAALAIARSGGRCVLTEPSEWIGGQLTSQGVPPDENAWVEGVGASASYKELRRRIRAWYRTNRPLTPEAREDERLNPGGGWVSRLCCEPSVAHAILEEMLAERRVPVLRRHVPVRADLHADHIDGLVLRDLDSGRETLIKAQLYLDASDTGELYPLAGVEHLLGSDARSNFGELHAPETPDERDQQAITWCFAVEHRPGEDHTIARPDRYDFWSTYVPRMTPPWPGPLFSWTVPSHDPAGARKLDLSPDRDPGEWELWRYRRIVDASIGAGERDVSLVNWVQCDYWLEPLIDGDRISTNAMDEARGLSRSLLYWLQTEAPRRDGGTGFPGLRLRGDCLGTDDGFAMMAYVREPRRLQARTMMHEGHLGREQRRQEGEVDPPDAPLGAGHRFADSVGIGHYMIDLHPSCVGRNSVYVEATPFRIPLGSLIPVRMRNLLASGKAMGVSHIVNGATRTHAVEWATGEAAGFLASFCLRDGTEPHAVADDPKRVEAVQHLLRDHDVPLSWPWETPA